MVDYCLVRRNQKKCSKDTNVSPSEECITQHKPLVCDFKIRKVKEARRKVLASRKIWKFHENSAKIDIRSYIKKYRESGQKDSLVEVYWNFPKETLK